MKNAVLAMLIPIILVTAYLLGSLTAHILNVGWFTPVL